MSGRTATRRASRARRRAATGASAPPRPRSAARERAHEDLGRVHRSRDADARHRAHRGGERKVRREGRVHGRRVGVEVEQPPDACDRGRQVGHGRQLELHVEARCAPSAPGRRPVGGPERARPVRQRERPRVGEQRAVEVDDLDAVDGARREEREHAARVERLAQGKGEVERGGGAAVVRGGPGGSGGGRAARVTGRRRPVGPGPTPQLARRRVEDLGDRVVELAHAPETGGERDVGEPQVRPREQRPRRLGAQRAGERDRAGAELRDEHAVHVPGRVPEAGGEAVDALAVHDAVRDEPHGPGRQVVPEVPARRARHRLREAALARAVAGLVGGGRGEVEGDVLGLRGPRRARRPGVDAGAAHGGDELPVEAAVARRDGAVALGEHGVRGRRGRREGRRHDSILTRRTTPWLAGFGHGGERRRRVRRASRGPRAGTSTGQARGRARGRARRPRP